MGIKRLIEFIWWHPAARSIIVSVDPKDLRGKLIFIDATISIYQWYAVGIAKNIVAAGQESTSPKYINHIQGLFFRTLFLLENGAHVVYVFDGRPPDEKIETLRRRKERPLRCKIPEWIFAECKTLCRLMGVPIVEAAGEAEAAAAQLAKRFGGITATEDSDAFPFGAPKVLLGLGVDSEMYIIDLKKLLSALSLTMAQFIDFCILMGSDYTGKIPGMGPIDCLRIIQTYKRIENIDFVRIYEDKKLARRLDKPLLQALKTFDYKRARKVFLRADASAARVRAKSLNRRELDEAAINKLRQWMLSKGIREILLTRQRLNLFRGGIKNK